MFERAGRTVPLTYEALLNATREVFRLLAREELDAQRGELTALRTELTVSNAGAVELKKAVIEVTVLPGERNAWQVERDNALCRAEVAEVADPASCIELRDAKAAFSTMGALRRKNHRLDNRNAASYGLVVGHNTLPRRLLEGYQESSNAFGTPRAPRTPLVDPDRSRESVPFNLVPPSGPSRDASVANSVVRSHSPSSAGPSCGYR